MVRTFGTGEEEVTLLLDQAGIEPYYTVSLIGHRIRPTNAQIMRIQFGDEPQTERSFVRGRFEDRTHLITMHGVNLAPIPPLSGASGEDIEPAPIGETREAAIQHIAFRGGLYRQVTLDTGSLDEPLAALRDCAADLVRHLGVGEGGNLKHSKPPTPKTNPATWATPDDYPLAMLRKGQEGVVRFRLTVTSQGKPTSCHITRSTRPQVFDDVVCLVLLKRATFDPALDHDGNPVASYWHSAVRFVAPS